MNNLLIDIGNTDIKTGVGNSVNFKVKFTGRFTYRKDKVQTYLKTIFNLLKFEYSFEKIGVSVLKDINKKRLEDFFYRKFGLNPVFIDRKCKLPFKINYSDGLGNDRICSAAAALMRYNKKNILIIDFGTATTFTLISGRILTGGLILPGIKTSLLSLIEKTSLPDVQMRFPRKLFNNNTSDNIKAGVLYQSLYSTERIISEAKKKYKDLFVISTGGYSELISTRTKLINIADPYLVLKGINYIISK